MTRRSKQAEGEMPLVFPAKSRKPKTLAYTQAYQVANQDRHLTEWQFETLGQRMARKQKEQAK